MSPSLTRRLHAMFPALQLLPDPQPDLFDDASAAAETPEIPTPAGVAGQPLPVAFRIVSTGPVRGVLFNLDQAVDAVAYWRQIIAHEPWFEPQREHYVVLFYNPRRQLTGHWLQGVGTSGECSANPSDTVRAVLLSGYQAFVVMHNHPSGNPAPSQDDRRITSRLRHAIDLFPGYQLLDHIIIGEAASETPFFSFMENGEIK